MTKKTKTEVAARQGKTETVVRTREKTKTAVRAKEKSKKKVGKGDKKAAGKTAKDKAAATSVQSTTPLKAPKKAPSKREKFHFEVERGYAVKPELYVSLGPKLLAEGFVLESVCVIVDTLLPAEKKGDTHRLRRQQYIGERKPVVQFMHDFKAHLKMPKGAHVRLEPKPIYVTARQAEELLTRYTNETCAPLPVYSKMRTTYVKMWKERKLSIALDLALGLGHFSGHNVELEVLIPVEEPSVLEVQREIDNYVEEIEAIETKIEKFAQKLFGEKLEPKLSYRKQRKKTWGIGGVGDN